MFFASVFNFIPAILQKKKIRREREDANPCTSLSLCTAPGRLVIFFPFRYVMRSFVISCISARRKLPPPLYFPREPGGIFPALLRRITAGLCSTHTHTHTYFLSLSLSFPFVRFLFPLLLRIVRSRPGERRRPVRVHTRNTPGQCCFRNSLVALYREHDRIAKVYKESRV